MNSATQALLIFITYDTFVLEYQWVSCTITCTFNRSEMN